ncbi:MAG: hypothetical protein J6S76_06260, partial [Clostridia bacterium]|nr:hypothetical protein [Clostridia bacterium]
AQLPSLLCGGLLLVLSPHVSAKLWGIVWLTTPLLSAWLSRSPVHRTEAMPDLKTLSGWAEEVWSYFSKYVSQDTMHLPPDNVQFFPDRDPHPAYRTSPTNIGLYLCACAAARDFSFITTEELYTRYEAALSGMERLQTYRGHFYNWYDIREGGVLGAPFVSAVDSGNLACSLICAAGAALDWAGEDERLFKTAERLRRLAARMDFSFLYDTKRRKMHIGYDTESGVPTRAYYDLYCSEARSAVYYAIAAGQIPSAAWSELRMPLLSTRGWLGAQSWTGSAFEYFMPVLWLSHPKDSFTREILHFAADTQSRDVLNITHGSRELSLFGKSEGAYFGIDSDRQFQYKPYGCADLALSVPDQKERLCMPYALFLMLCEKPTDVCRALHTLDVLGMHGACGYYEALDATHLRVGNGYAVVRSYMAHHLGMTIMALANAAFDGIFVKRFHRDAQMGAHQILQERRIPTDAVVAGRTVTRGHSADPSSLCTRESLASSASDISCCVGEGGEAQTAMISNSALCVLASVTGGMSVRCGEDAITPWSYEGNALSPTVLCTDIRTGRCYLPFAKWGHEDGVRYSFHCGKGVLEWAADYPDQMRCVLRTELSSQGLGVRFSVSLTEGGIPQPMLLVFLTRPVLIGHRAHSSHPAFADLFLISEIDSQAHQIRVHRRVRTPDERPYVLNACAKSLGGFRAVTDSSTLLPPGYGDREVRRLGEIRSDNPVLSAHSAPSAVTPVLCMLGRSAGTAEIQLTLGALQTRFDSSVMQELHAELRQMCGALRTVEYREMLCAIKGAQRIRLYESKLPMRAPRASRGTSRLWKYGISGDLPHLCFVALEDEASLGHLGWVLGAWKYLLLCGIGSDLVLCVKETDVYGHPVDGRIRTCIHQRGLSFFMGEGSKRGALRICLYRDAVSDGLLLTAAAVYGDTLQPHPIEGARDISILQTPRRDDRLRQCRVEDGCAVIWDGAARMPWSHILSNGVMGCLMTQHTLGFTFFENARECRVTPWWGDVSREESGELILMRRSEEGAFSDLCGMADTTIVMPDAMHYLGAGNGFSYRITVTIPNRSRTKEISISVRNESDVPLSLILRYQLIPLLGVSPVHGDAISFFFDTDGLHFRTETGDRCAWYEANISLTGAEKREGGPWGDQMLYAGGMLALAPGEEQTVRAYLRIKRYGERELAVGAAKQSRSWQYPVIKTDSAQLDALASAWLPWQTVTVRMFARCGYYQPGGAYGFRDQLQDALAASIFAPELLYAQLFRAAAHQYPEGDVQH